MKGICSSVFKRITSHEVLHACCVSHVSYWPESYRRIQVRSIPFISWNIKLKTRHHFILIFMLLLTLYLVLRSHSKPGQKAMKWLLELILCSRELRAWKWRIKRQAIINIYLYVACHERPFAGPTFGQVCKHNPWLTFRNFQGMSMLANLPRLTSLQRLVRL